MRNYKHLFSLIVIFLGIGLLCFANYNQSINYKELTKDSLETVYLGYNLAVSGNHSMDGVSPSYYREPFLSGLNALNILRLNPENNHFSKEDLVTSPFWVKKVTSLNLFYLALIYFLTYYLTRILDLSKMLSLAAAFIPTLFFAVFTSYITSVNSELPSAVLIVTFSIFVVKFYKREEISNGILLGIIFGLLALTKAVFLYLFIVLVPCWIGIQFFFQRPFKKIFLRDILIVSLSFALVVCPWMLRNYYHFEDFSITERGGQVLLMRAELDQMNQEEFDGGFYAYGPVYLQKKYFEKWRGYQPSDLIFGGKLQRLNRGLDEDRIAIAEGRRDDIKSYYRLAQYKYIESLRLDSRIAENGEDEAMHSAKNLIFSNFFAHLKTTLLFGYRGIWFYQGRFLAPVVLCFLMFISLPVLFLVGLNARDLRLLVLSLVPLLYFLFHAFLTHYIPRYSGTLVPILSVILILCLKHLLSAIHLFYFKIDAQIAK